MENPQPPQGPQSPVPGSQPPAPGPQSPGFPPPPAPEQPQPYGGPLASWGTRLAAYVIDGLIIFVPAFILLAIFGVGVASGDSVGAFIGGLILTVVVVTVIALLYAPLLMMREGPRNGQTIGK